MALIGTIVIMGWFWSFCLNTVEQGAAGEDDLPGFIAEGGWYEGIVSSLLKFAVTWLIALLPALLYQVGIVVRDQLTLWDALDGLMSVFLMGMTGGPVGATPREMVDQWVTLGLFAAGLALWPTPHRPDAQDHPPDVARLCPDRDPGLLHVRATADAL
jgi:hypothetical protein